MSGYTISIRVAGIRFVLYLATCMSASAQVPCQVALLEPSDAAKGPNGFGTSVAIDGDYAVFGARNDTPDNTGAVYVFKRDGLRWVEQTKLFGSAVGFHANLGWSVDIDGNRLIAGAPYMDPAGGAPGQAYVFERSGETWAETALLSPSVSSEIDAFGIDVAIDGDVAVVGAFYRGAEPGKAFVFRWSGNNWVEEGIFSAPGHTNFDGFGFSVDADENTVVVGSFDDGSGAAPSGDGGAPGAAYVFEHDGADWSLSETLSGDQTGYADAFGFAASLSNDLIVIGAIEDGSVVQSAGAAYLFRRDAGSWLLEDKLTRPDGAIQDWFGIGVAAYESRLLVANSQASVFAFQHDGSSWTGAGALFGGRAVAIHGTYGVSSPGYVYAFDPVPPCIPATSFWRLLMLVMLLLSVATHELRKHQRANLRSIWQPSLIFSSGAA